MTLKTFEENHSKQGGVKKLSEMKEDNATLESISKHFGVSKTRVRQWMDEIFGQKYDPRKTRRDKKVEAISNMIKKFGVKKTKEIYHPLNKYYLRDAIKITKTNDIKRQRNKRSNKK